MLRQAQRVLRHRRFDRRAHLWGRSEEAVGRGEPLQPLVRALEVVVLHEECHPALAIVEVGEHRSREKLLPHRLPEALDLAAGLRVVRAALHVPDAVTAKLFLEARLPAPGRVLASLVSEDLPRRAMIGDPPRERLQHERAPLVVRHHQAHEIARVIIQERRHIHPLVAAQQEGKQVRLPELIGLGALEALGLCRGLRPRRRAFLREPPHLQHPAHRRLRCPDAEEAPHHVADAPAARLWLGSLRRYHRLVAGIGPRQFMRPLAPTPRSGPERSASAPSILLRPLRDRRVRDLQLDSHARGGQPFIHHHRCCRHHHVPRPRRPGLALRTVFAPCWPLISFRLHSYSPFGLLRQPNRR